LVQFPFDWPTLIFKIYFTDKAIAKIIITRADVHANEDFLTYTIDVKNTTTGTYLDINIDITKPVDGIVLVRNFISFDLNSVNKYQNANLFFSDRFGNLQKNWQLI
jgi:hypothetical protein